MFTVARDLSFPPKYLFSHEGVRFMYQCSLESQGRITSFSWTGVGEHLCYSGLQKVLRGRSKESPKLVSQPIGVFEKTAFATSITT